MNHEGFIQPGHDHSWNPSVIIQLRCFSQLIPEQTTKVRRLWLLCVAREGETHIRQIGISFKLCSVLVYDILLVLVLNFHEFSLESHIMNLHNRNNINIHIFRINMIKSRFIPKKVSIFWRNMVILWTPEVRLRLNMLRNWGKKNLGWIAAFSIKLLLTLRSLR